jgi:hypothetical protein
VTPAFGPLDELIDEYIAWERGIGPKLGFPDWGAGTEDSGSNNSFQSAEALLDESVTAIRMAGMTGAWASLTVRQERALRLDADNRAARATVWRAGTPEQMAGQVLEAKLLLRRLLTDRNIVC